MSFLSVFWHHTIIHHQSQLYHHHLSYADVFSPVDPKLLLSSQNISLRFSFMQYYNESYRYHHTIGVQQRYKSLQSMFFDTKNHRLPIRFPHINYGPVAISLECNLDYSISAYTPSSWMHLKYFTSPLILINCIFRHVICLGQVWTVFTPEINNWNYCGTLWMIDERNFWKECRFSTLEIF